MILRRFFGWVVALPIAIVLILLAVANREPVTVSLDPFSPTAPAYAAEWPLFVVILGAAMAGVLIGGVATWLGQARWRREARQRRSELAALRAETERLRRTAATTQPATARLALPPTRPR